MGIEISVISSGVTDIFINKNNMANRRMFSQDIVCSEEFLDMPPTTRDLYIQLSVRADDDGFIQPKLVMKMLGSTIDDLKILIAKRFLISFETGVVVIKHWLIHNLIRQDRYKETRFKEEKKSLQIKENGSYTELGKLNGNQMATKWQPNGNQMATQVRIGKDRLGKVSISKNKFSQEGAEVIKLFEIVNPSIGKYYKNTTQRGACDRLLEKWSLQELKLVIGILPEMNADKYAKGKSITPLQLEDNLGHIKSWIDQKKANKPKVAII